MRDRAARAKGSRAALSLPDLAVERHRGMEDARVREHRPDVFHVLRLLVVRRADGHGPLPGGETVRPQQEHAVGVRHAHPLLADLRAQRAAGRPRSRNRRRPRGSAGRSWPCGRGAGSSAMASTLVIRSTRDLEQFALPVQRIVSDMDRDLPVWGCAHDEPVARPFDARSELQRGAARRFCHAVAGPGRGGPVRRHVVYRCAADDRNRHPRRAGRKT